MRIAPPPPAALAAMSGEFALACDVNGRIGWADERARRRLACQPGDRLDALVAPGTEPKLEAMLAQAAREPLSGWEVALVIDGRPQTVSFSAVPHAGGVALLGQVLSPHLLESISRASEAMGDVVRLNRRVVSQKKELERRHQELLRLHQELGEIHMGVLTMHAELEDRGAELVRTAELKARIASNVSHEFRTPLYSILGLADLLAAGHDGPLGAEQARQVEYIRRSATELLHLVDDMLDLARNDAGRGVIRRERFDLGEFLASQKGVLRPLLPEGSRVRLEFDTPAEAVWLETDKAKLSQVLRNLVSNAIKFTEQGEVRVGARLLGADEVAIDVADTGIGIAAQDRERVFEEFGQVESPLQQHRKGSGLGLALSRRLAQMLGGSLTVRSTPGAGSTFTLSIPRVHAGMRETQRLGEHGREEPAGRDSLLAPSGGARPKRRASRR